MAMNSRLHIAAMKPMDPMGHQPVPPRRITSRTTVLSPGDKDYERSLAASAGAAGSAVDTTPLREPGTGDYSTIGWIAPSTASVVPGAVTHGRG